MPNIGETYVVGGQGVINECLNNHKDNCKLVIETRVNKEYEADTFMPKLSKDDFSPIFVSQTYS